MKVTEVREMSIADLRDRIEIEKNNLDTMKLNHVERLQRGDCSLTQGFVFNDLLGDFERVADHCSNLALALIELQSDEFDTHGYILDLKERHSHDFDRLYEQYSEEFKIG